MAEYTNSDQVRTPSAKYARQYGYRVHHDINGWYVVGPHEEEPTPFGGSLGFDGRWHSHDCEEAWRMAEQLASKLFNGEC